MARALPPSPSLEHLKNQAKLLLQSFRSGNPEAHSRLQARVPRLASHAGPELAAVRVTLSDAQLTLAREYGFPSWPKLKQAVESLPGGNGHLRAFVRELSYYEERAAGLVSVHQGGLPSALALIRRHHPRFAAASDAEIRAAAFGPEDARLVFAREHGFPDWSLFRRHVDALSRGEAVEPFLDAFEAVKAGDLSRLRALLHQYPDVLNARGTNGNSLLSLALSSVQTGDLSRPPQVDGERLPAGYEIVQFLVEAGADVNLANHRGWTPLHQAGYSNNTVLAEYLLRHGADPTLSAHGEGGTPLVQALFWGHREAAELLAAHSLAPGNLRVAAGLGRVGLLETLALPDGSLPPAAGAHRAFYRPHTGFPVWSPSDNRQEVLDEALVWASKSGRVEILPHLLRLGADLNADPYRGTALLWAATKNRLETARWLLDHGAEVNRRATFGGPGHGQGVTALHLAAQSGLLEMVQLLVARGADPTIKEENYGATPGGWAGHFGHTQVRDWLAAQENAA